MRKGCSGARKTAILLQFLTIDPHFVRKGWRFVTPRRHHPRPKERKIKKARERKGREKGEKMWRWEDVKRSRCEDEQMWRWADVKMSRCEDEQMWRWEGVSRCEDVQRWRRRCEDEKMWRWEDVKMRRCEGVKMRRCEDEKVWRWEDVREGVKMRRWDTDPHYWKNPALRRSREKIWMLVRI